MQFRHLGFRQNVAGILIGVHMKRAVVTGVGIVAPGSVGKEKFWENMRRGKVFTGYLKSMDSQGIRCPVSAEVEEEQIQPYRKRIEAVLGMELSRTEFLAVLGTHLALEDSGLSLKNLQGICSHVALGSTMGIEDSRLRLEPPELLASPNKALIHRYAPFNIVNTVKKYLEAEKGSGGDITTRMFMNACAAGNYAIGDAFDEIRQGRCEMAVAGGVDALSYLAIVGFNRLLSVTPDLCRPFDRDRKGIVVGEGAGVLILEERDRAMKRGAHIYGEISGYGLGMDGYHITTPHPKGRGAVQAMKRALEQAKLSPRQIQYISAHGTGTVANDVAEYVAASAVFEGNIPPTSSIKSMIGHTMGAASGIEAVACCLMLERNELLPTANFVTPDERCPVDCVPNTSRKVQLTNVMSNALAFGGNNSSIIFSKNRINFLEIAGHDAGNEEVVISKIEVGKEMKLVFKHTMNREEVEAYFEKSLPHVNPQMADMDSMMLTGAIHRGMKENGIDSLPAEATAIVSESHGAAILSSIAFYQNVIKKGAIGASPMAFPNTVGNAPASRAAIWLGFRDKVVSLSGKEGRSGEGAISYAKKLMEGDSQYAFACDCSPEKVMVTLIEKKSPAMV